MPQIFLFLSALIIIIASCKQVNEPNQDHATMVIKDTASIATTTTKIEKTMADESVEEDTIIQPNFEAYLKKGLLIPHVYAIYNETLDSIGNFTVEEITEIKILQKTKKKLAQFKKQDYCDWSNFVHAVYQEDTLILFGKTILHDLSEKPYRLNNTYPIQFILAQNMRMGMMDDQGLTLCDDFSYMIIKAEESYHFVYGKRADEQPGDFMVLHHNDGISEYLDQTIIVGDTLKLQVKADYQEGTGAFEVLIFKADQWRSLEKNRKHFH